MLISIYYRFTSLNLNLKRNNVVSRTNGFYWKVLFSNKFHIYTNRNPITSQPSAQIPGSLVDWKYGILECCDVHHDCAIACCFPHCYAYCAAQAAGDSITSSVCNCLLFPLCLCCLRQKVRLFRNIEVNICTILK